MKKLKLLLSAVLLSMLIFTSCDNDNVLQTEEIQTIESKELRGNLKKKRIDLTGAWHCYNDRGTYYIRQIGDAVYWFGEDRKMADIRKSKVSNVFSGYINYSSNILTGNFYDVPKGKYRNSGEIKMKLEVAEGKVLSIATTSDSPSFKGYIWQRKHYFPNDALFAEVKYKPGFQTGSSIHDITGLWKGYGSSGNAMFYIAQYGNTVVWFGEKIFKAPKERPNWSNVAFGRRNGNSISLDWVDVGKGRYLNGLDFVDITVENNNTLKLDKDSNFGTDLWRKIN